MKQKSFWRGFFMVQMFVGFCALPLAPNIEDAVASVVVFLGTLLNICIGCLGSIIVREPLPKPPVTEDYLEEYYKHISDVI